MKILNVPARLKVKEAKIDVSGLPSELYIAYSIQFENLAKSIKKQLEKKLKVTGFSQVLGCTKLNSKSPILLIGSGRFHAINLAINSGKEVYIYNNGNIEKLSQKEIDIILKKKQGALSKFYSANNIGIIVSTKPGQNHLKQAIELKKAIKDKKTYIFLSNNISINELENFQIESWINSACSGLALDKTMLNIDDLNF